MKVFLITARQPHVKNRWLPIGLAYLASSLRSKGHEVAVYDRTVRTNFVEDVTDLNMEMRNEIQSFEPDIIGFSTVSPIIYDTVETVEYVRSFFNGTIVAGGHHATALPAVTLEKIPGIDYIIAGEAEYSLRALADGVSPCQIPGVFSRDTNPDKFINAQINNLDDLPMPDYSVFDMSYYTEANHYTIRNNYLKVAEVLSSRGCNNNCSFCSESLTYGKGVRFHSAGYVIENIERLLVDYDINGIYFHDNDFLISRNHAESICRMMIDRKLNKRIRWAIQSGTDKVNDDLFKLLSEAGCATVEFGMESIKDEDLVRVHKNRGVELNENAIKVCNKYGISAHGYFISGLESETMEDLNALISWIKRNNPHTFTLSKLQIHPGTQLYREKGNHFFENNPWDEATIKNYYESNSQSEISHEIMDKWYKEVWIPFSIKHHRKWLIRKNPKITILRIATKRLLDKMHF